MVNQVDTSSGKVNLQTYVEQEQIPKSKIVF